MQISIKRDHFSTDVVIAIRSDDAYQVSHLDLPRIEAGKIPLKDFYKFLIDLEFVLNKSIGELDEPHRKKDGRLY